VSGNRHGIYLSSSSNCMIANVTASENYFNGISLYYSKNNTISNVKVANNRYGVSLGSSDKNTITKGYFINNEVGIYLWDSNNNLIYDNYFNSTENASISAISAGSNIWNASKTPGKNIVGGNYLGGNYWGSTNGKGFSDTCSDSNYDGFCDQPFAIDDKNIDYFPLAKVQIMPKVYIEFNRTSVAPGDYFAIDVSVQDGTAKSVVAEFEVGCVQILTPCLTSSCQQSLLGCAEYVSSVPYPPFTVFTKANNSTPMRSSRKEQEKI
jgi:parallel beta-helix repeat protein